MPDGDKLGRYSLVRRIGKGGMGEVWLAKIAGAHGFEKNVALKRILPQFSENAHVVNMLVDEARISVLLNHPNVVQVLELGEDNGQYFIAMEYVEGHALSRLLRKLKKAGKRLDVLDACYIAICVLEGLHAAHVQKDQRGKPANIIHRDVSPQNVLLSMEGVVKVIDFGIARAVERLEVTQGSAVKGKLRYMAPEQLSPKLLKGKPIDHRVDVFASGIVLFEMLANRQRFGGDAELEIMDAILKEDTPDLCREGYIDRELMDIVDTALTKNRDERFKDAVSFAAKLRSYLYKRDPGFTAERIAKRMQQYFGEDEDGAEQNAAPEPPVEMSQGQKMRAARGGTQSALVSPNDTELVDDPDNPFPKSGNDRDFASSQSGVEERDDREATRTAFRPAVVRAQERAQPRMEPEEDSELEDDVEEDAPRRGPPARRKKSSAAPVFAGLLLGAGLLAFGWVVMKPKLFPPRPISAFSTTNPTNPTTTGDPVANPSTTTTTPTQHEEPRVAPVSSDGAVEMLIEAEPATTRISLADAPDPKYVSPARVKFQEGATVELVFEADGYETEHHKVVVTRQAPLLHIALHALPVDLRVHVYPRDSIVTVNGQPMQIGQKVIPGQLLTIKAEHPLAKEPVVVQKIPVPGETLNIDMRLEEVEHAAPVHVPKAILNITSTPPGAEVFIDETRVKGQTPMEAHVAPGKHRVVVHVANTGEKSFVVDVQDGATAAVNAILQ